MLTLPAELLNIIVVFAPLFTKPVFEHAKLLLLAALLAPSKRTVTASLRVVGLSHQNSFQNYHRVLNPAKWSALHASRILLGLILLLLPSSSPVIIGADDTIERRRGEKILGLGCYRDPLKSTRKYGVKCFGLKWLSLMLLVKLPWSSRVWALPFLTTLCRAQTEGQPHKEWPTKRRRNSHKAKGRKAIAKTKAKASSGLLSKSTPRQHKTAVDILMILIRVVHRWLPERLLVLVVEGGYAAVKLALLCAGTPNLALVTGLRWDAAMYHKAQPRPAGKQGPTPLKGARQRALKEWAARSDTAWQKQEVTWYGGRKKKMQLFSRTALWYRPGEVPVRVRYIITRDPEGKLRDEVFACTKLDATPAQIIEWVVQRWSVETTFEEAREHLGMETQRQWNSLAIGRTTPWLLGLFSVVVLLSKRLQPDGKVPVLTTAWYKKAEATFSDCMALVRKDLWSSIYPVKSDPEAELIYFPAQAWEHWLSGLAAVA